jgi:hypothetical protein
MIRRMTVLQENARHPRRSDSTSVVELIDMKTIWFIAALSISMVCSVEAQVAPSLATNSPADGRPRHTIYASQMPVQEPATEPQSFAPTNGPLTDLRVVASTPVREIRLLEDGRFVQ